MSLLPAESLPESGPATGPQAVDVVVPVALDRAYSYAAPAELGLAPGDVVRVPLGTRESLGVVWSVAAGSHGGNLKAVAARLDTPPLPVGLRRFVDWVAAYTLAPRGMVARMAMRDPEREAGERPRVGVRLTGTPPGRLTPARARVLAAAEGGLVFSKSQLAQAAGVSTGVVDALVDEGALEALALAPASVAPPPDAAFARPMLSEAQQAAAERLGAAVGGGFSVTLLEGVTGSGKTEVYFEAVAAALAAGRQVLIMLPEIALTAQFLGRFEARFGVRPAEWHSGVASSRKDRLWRAVASGEAKVVAGARSALFLPFRSLGLLIVDEEHEQAYKQDDGVHYHARDMAVVRGRIEGAAVVLASATPSIESRVNAHAGRYGHVLLPERFGGRVLPRLAAIDLRRQAPPRGQWLAPPLVAAIRETVAAGEQALLFLNRRGFAPLTLCRHCGHRWQCPNCSAWLVEHRFRRALICHHCGHLERTPASCTECGTADAIVPCGPGVERLAEEVAVRFPEVRRVVLSSDFPGGTERLKRELEAVAAGEFQIIIGTQLVAKGHNFPALSLVGVVDADVGLMNGDPRAAERTFQLLQQVTGRAGRGHTRGRGLLQTHDPDHPVMRALLTGDAERFYAEETALRREGALPPFGRLVGIVVSGTDKAATEAHARALAAAGHAVQHDASAAGWADVLLLGPAEAPLAMVRGRHRQRLLIKASRACDVQGFVRAMLAAAPKERGSVRVGVDVDPMSFL
jgi:primosomal protein N' (replication factor Y)